VCYIISETLSFVHDGHVHHVVDAAPHPKRRRLAVKTWLLRLPLPALLVLRQLCHLRLAHPGPPHPRSPPLPLPPVLRSSLKVPRSLILDMPFSSAPSLNHLVRANLDEIASNTIAHIAVVNSPVSGASPSTRTQLGPRNRASLRARHLWRRRRRRSRPRKAPRHARPTRMSLSLIFISMSHLSPERSALRVSRNRAQTSPHHRWSKAVHSPVHPGGNCYQYLLPFTFTTFPAVSFFLNRARQKQKHSMDHRRVLRRTESKGYVVSNRSSKSFSSPFPFFFSILTLVPRAPPSSQKTPLSSLANSTFSSFTTRTT
jgi:hypothetical protein